MLRAGVARLALLIWAASASLFAQAAGDQNHTNGNTTRTQTIQVGEPSTTHPGGNPGRTTGRTTNQNPFAGKPPAQDPTLYPKCLYDTAAYSSGQVTRLRADTLVQGLPVNSFNCFAYAETFIADKFPTSIFGGTNITLTPKWLGQHNYAMVAAAGTLDQLPPARLGDLILVENKDTRVGSYQWYHVAIVVGVDSASRIAKLRQKPDENRCVFDTTADQFEALDPVRNGEQYELWRNPSLQWSQKLAP